jgi:hypothetical protein
MHALILGAEDVRYDEPATWLQYAEDLAEGVALVLAQVDHAVRQDNVDRVICERQALDDRLLKPDVRLVVTERPGNGVDVPPRHLQHLRRHVDADDPPRAPDLLRGDEGVEARSGPEVHDHVAATEAHLHAAERGRTALIAIEDLRRDPAKVDVLVCIGEAQGLCLDGGFAVVFPDP